MKTVKALDALLALALALAAGVFLVAGVFLWPCFILAAGALAGYFFFSRHLRCPRCGEKLEPAWTLKRAGKYCACPNCGGELAVEKLPLREKKGK